MGKRKRSSLWGLVKKTNIHRYMGDRVSQYGRPRFCTEENMKSQQYMCWQLTLQLNLSLKCVKSYLSVYFWAMSFWFSIQHIPPVWRGGLGQWTKSPKLCHLRQMNKTRLFPSTKKNCRVDNIFLALVYKNTHTHTQSSPLNLCSNVSMRAVSGRENSARAKTRLKFRIPFTK